MLAIAVLPESFRFPRAHDTMPPGQAAGYVCFAAALRFLGRRILPVGFLPVLKYQHVQVGVHVYSIQQVEWKYLPIV